MQADGGLRSQNNQYEIVVENDGTIALYVLTYDTNVATDTQKEVQRVRGWNSKEPIIYDELYKEFRLKAHISVSFRLLRLVESMYDIE